MHWCLKYQKQILPKQPACMYQLGFSRGPHDRFLGLSLVELVLNTWWTWPTNINVSLFFGQVHPVKQVKVSNKEHEDHCWPLINTYKLIEYSTLAIFRDNFFLRQDLYFKKFKYLGFTANLYLSMKGPQRLLWSFFRTFTCWTCLKHLVNLANKFECILFWPSLPNFVDKFNKWKSKTKILRTSDNP